MCPGEAATQAVAAQIMRWRFEPILEADGPVAARAHAALQVHVTESAGRDLTLSISRARFTEPPGTPLAYRAPGGVEWEALEVVERVVPTYPTNRAAAREQAQVILLVEIGSSGEVLRTGVWSAHFINSQPLRSRERALEYFVNAAKSSAQRWRFNPSTLERRTVLQPFLFAYRNTDTDSWVRVYPMPEAREGWIDEAVAAENEAGRPLAEIDDQPTRFVLIDELQPPWM